MRAQKDATIDTDRRGHCHFLNHSAADHGKATGSVSGGGCGEQMGLAIFAGDDDLAITKHRRGAIGVTILRQFTAPKRRAGVGIQAGNRALVGADDQAAILDGRRWHIGAKILARPSHMAGRDIAFTTASDGSEGVAAGIRRDDEITGNHWRSNRAEEFFTARIEPTHTPQLLAAGHIVRRDVVSTQHKHHFLRLLFGGVTFDNHRC